ncbi:MAG: serine--tRNA ligase [Patescibacteria group bacterium]
MIDINFIRQNPEKVKEGIAKKNTDPKLVEKFLRLDEAWRSKTAALDQLKAEQNILNKELSKARSEDLVSKAQIIKRRVTEIVAERNKQEEKRDEILNQLPNPPFEDVPVGKSEADNKVLREVGEKPKFKFQVKDYLTIGESLNLINVKKAAEVTSSRFGYLLGDAAILEFALVQLAMETAVKEGFLPVVPPVMIRPEVFTGMGRLASSQKDERYFLSKDNLYLVGSAEHTLGPLHMNEVLEVETLPRRYVGFSTCFRREAGSYGKDTKGILRVHQFDKIEMFSFANPKDSEKEHEFMLGIQEKLMKALELPYRVVAISTGDMGWTDARQYDIETWLPGQNNYRETHSCSNTTDFQSRGINAKYRDKNSDKKYVHMLNGTAFAIGRIIIAILENYQNEDGTVRVPKALQDYLGKKVIGKN